MLTGAAISGMKKALEVLRESGQSGKAHERPDLIASMDEITDLMGYDRINSLESQFLLSEELERKYLSGKPDYLVRE